MSGRTPRRLGLALAALAVACGGAQPASTDTKTAVGGSESAAPAPQSPATPPMAAAIPDPATVPAIELEGPCGKAVEAHLRARDEPALELVAAVLYESCREDEWDSKTRQCIAAAAGVEAITLCREAGLERALERDVASGALPKSGVPACDRYYEEHLACMTKVSPEHVAQLRSSFARAAAQTRKTITSETRVIVSKNCKDAHRRMADSYKQCKWSVR